MINNLMLKYTYKLSNFLNRTTKHQLQKLQVNKVYRKKTESAYINLKTFKNGNWKNIWETYEKMFFNICKIVRENH